LLLRSVAFDGFSLRGVQPRVRTETRLAVDFARQVIAEVGATAATFLSPKHFASSPDA
jgi:hypothetical protein